MLALDPLRLDAADAKAADLGLPRRLAITSVFGDPRNPRTWSGAPNNLATALEELGFEVTGLHVPLGPVRKLVWAGRHLLAGYGRIPSSEAILRGPAARRFRASGIAGQAASLGIRDVLHTGTLDLPATDLADGVRHYLYCDQTWQLSLRYRPDAESYRPAARRHFDALEHQAYHQMRHIFTFGAYVRDNLIEAYGLPPDRVTVVGSGMGNIRPFTGEKDYTVPRLLFVAKHLFAAKGGHLLLDAFRLALARRPDLELDVVGSPELQRAIGAVPNVTLHGYLAWADLEALFHRATLLVQPMLNDPWGQVYIEALLSRTPVIGLDRNGLPEIVEGGRHGFLVGRAEPAALAETILAALSQPERLARMGETGQRHALASYGWPRVASRVADVLMQA